MSNIEFEGYHNEELSNQLLDEVESGMGYQIIDADASGKYYIFNGEYILPYDAYDNFRNYMTKNPEINFDEIFTNTFTTNFDGIGILDQIKENGVASKTKKHEVFFRFSAFPNDKRVSNRKLAHGTYATTRTDIEVVPSGLAAVGRYALPNPSSAKYVSIIIPKPDTDIVICTVQPKYQQAGGGVEVFFPDGAEFEYQAYKISDA